MIKQVRKLTEWGENTVIVTENQQTKYYCEPYPPEIQTLLDDLDKYPGLKGIWYLTDDPTIREAVKLAEEIMNRPQPEVWVKGQCFIRLGNAYQITRVTCRKGIFKSVSVRGLIYPKYIPERTNITFDSEDLSKNTFPCTLDEVIQLFNFQAKVYDYEWELY